MFLPLCVTIVSPNDVLLSGHPNPVSGLLTKHSIVGLEAGRRCYMPGGVETRLHCAILPCAWLQHDDGQSLRDAFLQDGQ